MAPHFWYNAPMALTHHSSKLCDYLIQAVDGKFTLAGCFTNMFCAELPLARPVGMLVEFSGEVGDPFRISVDGPPETNVEHLLAEGSIERPPLRNPLEQWSATIGGMVGIVFPVEGTYRVILRSGDSIVHEYPFAVIVHRPEAAPAQSVPPEVV